MTDVLEVPLGFVKDPSVDRVLAELPREAGQKLTQGFQRAFGSVETIGRDAFHRLHRVMFSAMGVAGIGGLGYEIKKVMDLDRSTKQLAHSARLTAEQEANLVRTVKESAIETGVAREDQIAGLQLLQENYGMVEKLAAEGTLASQIELGTSMAKAFNMTFAETQDLMGSLNKIGISGDKMTETMAFLEQAGDIAGVDFGTTGGALQGLLGPAEKFSKEGGNAVRTVTAIFGATKAFTGDAARAEKYTRSFLSNLSDADVGKKLKKSLHVSTTDAKGEFRDLQDIINETLAKTQGMTAAKRTATLEDIFGEGAQVLDALTSGVGGEAFKGIVEVETDSEAFADYLKEQADSSATQLERLAQQVRVLVDDAIEPLAAAIVKHKDSIVALAKYIAANPIRSAVAIAFGPSLGKFVLSQIGKAFTSKTVTDAIGSKFEATTTMNVTAAVVNVNGAGGIPGGGVPGAAGKALEGFGKASLMGRILAPLAGTGVVAQAAELGVTVPELMSVLGMAGVGTGVAVGAGAAVGGAVLTAQGAALSDTAKRYQKGRVQDVWTRAEGLSEEGKQAFKDQYWQMNKEERSVEKLNKMIDVLQAIEQKKTSVKVSVAGAGYPDQPPSEVGVQSE